MGDANSEGKEKINNFVSWYKNKNMKIFKTIIFAMALVLTATSCNSQNKTESQEQKAKYIFLFIGDGMGFDHVSVTEAYLSWKDGALGGSQVAFTGFPVHGSCTTHSANSNITDSSAAGTAISTGEKTNNGHLGVDPEGNPGKSITYDLKEDGYKIGIISSVPINHATPGSFYANSKDRGDYYSITQQIPASGFEYFASAGFLGYFGEDGNSESSAEWLEKNGYDVCFGKEEFEQSSKVNERIVLCQEYNKDVEPQDYDSTGNKPEGNVSLREMLEYGISFLGTEQPFFIMCEGGEIDWTSHGNKTIPTINAIVAFSDAIAEAYEFYKQHPDETLIVVTADHATGGVSIGANGKYVTHFEELEKSWKENGNTNNLDSKENRKLNDKANIGWTTDGHTGEAVPVYAVGVGAERFGGRMDNSDIKGKILGE